MSSYKRRAGPTAGPPPRRPPTRSQRRPPAKVQAGAPRDRGAVSPRRLDQLRGDSGLADPSLSGQSGDAPMADPRLTPDLDQGLEFGDPARERVTVTEW